MAIGACEAILDVRSRRALPVRQIFRNAIGAVAARANCKDFLFLIPVMEGFSLAVEMTLPELETNTHLRGLIRPSRRGGQKNCRDCGNRGNRQSVPMRSSGHPPLLPKRDQVVAIGRSPIFVA